MLNGITNKCASFSCHVDYATYVEWFGNLQTPLGNNLTESPQSGNFKRFSLSETFGETFASFSCHVEYVEHVEWHCKNVLLSDVILNMLKGVSSKRLNISNIFNMTAERSTSLGEGIQHVSTFSI